MKSYGQHCSAARALDVVGDRWSLLIVRELLFRDARYSQLADGLPGIATNLLADRLRALTADGVLHRTDDHYGLTDRGRALAPVIRALTLWGAPLMLQDASGDARRGHWVACAADALFADIDTGRLPPLRAALTAEDETVLITVQPGTPVEVTLGYDSTPASVTVTAALHDMLLMLLGLASDVQIDGDEPAFRTLIDQGHKPLRAA